MSAVRPLPIVSQTFHPAPKPETASPLVIFDLDGTLVDTAPDLTASLNHCLAQVKLPPMTVESVRPHAGHGAQAMIREAYRQANRVLPSDELAQQTGCFLSFYQRNIAVESRIFDGGLAMLDRLAVAGMHLAVCTNKTEHLAVHLLREMNLFDRFAAICGADTFAARKPDPVHLFGSIERAGGDIARSVMVGDTLTDIAAARAAGVPSILALFGYDPGEEARYGASVSIQNFAELTPDLVQQVLSAKLTIASAR